VIKADQLFPEVAEDLKKDIGQRQQKGVRLEFRNLCVRKVELILVRNYADNNKDEYTVRISAHAQKIITQQGRTISQEDYVTPFEQFWTFGRLDRQWKLKEILPPTEGQQMIAQENVDETVAVTRKGLTIDPQAKDLYNLQGAAYMRLGNYREAVESFQHYVALAPNDPNALDSAGVAPLHRAVRTRSLAAVRALLDGGANSRQPNKVGSTPLHLAVQTTGRGGSGSPQAREQQAGIVRLLLERGAKVTDRDRQGKEVHQAATSQWIRALLGEASAG